MTYLAHDPHASLDLYQNAEPIGEVDGLRARRVRLPRGGAVPWHMKTASRTTVYAHAHSVVVQIRKPPFRNTMKRGEHYTVPANVPMTAYAADGGPLDFTVFEYGEHFEAVATDPPTLAYVVERSRLPVPAQGGATAFAPEHVVDYDSFAPGFSRMDVIAAPDRLRLILQGHGVRECVPWHSHDHIADTFFCVKGALRIATRSPDQVAVLEPGDTYQVAPGVAHFVSGVNGAPCEVLILQGVGSYNYVER